MRDHLRNVFSDTPIRAALTLSMLYSFKSNKAHKRCSGDALSGRIADILDQMMAQICGVVPKKCETFDDPCLCFPSCHVL